MPSPAKTLLWLIGCLVWFTGAGGAFAAARTPAVKARILPSGSFLRQYDPITVTFSKPLGAGRQALETKGAEFLKIVPAQPGRYRWLNGSTLEFRPSSPWPALARFAVSSNRAKPAVSRVYRTLLLGPQSMTPAVGSKDQAGVRRLLLKLSQDVTATTMEQALSIRLHPVGNPSRRRTLKRSQWLLKRARRVSSQAWYVYFARSLPAAHRVFVRLNLALRGKDIPRWEGSFTTRLPFQLLTVRCKNSRTHIAWSKAYYPQTQALDCGGGNARPTLHFSQILGNNPASLLRSLVRISPSVKGLTPHVSRKTVTYRGQFKRNVLYRLDIIAGRLPLKDNTGQLLNHRGRQTLFFFLGKKEPTIHWQRGRGIVERHGPMMLPLFVRGFKKLDLRIYRVAADDKRFWNFPKTPIAVDETQKPAAPGKEPKLKTPNRSNNHLRTHLRLLGTPDFSKVITLPAFAHKRGGSFGLNLRSTLLSLLKKGTLGKGNSFLVGYRPLDGSHRRFYARLQVTDLALSTVEQKQQIHFVVTSAKTAKPIAGARVVLEGIPTDYRIKIKRWKVLASGITNANGLWKLSVNRALKLKPLRIRVVSGDDHLLLNTSRRPPAYISNHWSSRYGRWLGWMTRKYRPSVAKTMAHVWTDRPIYRPGEVVYLQTLLRSVNNGALALPPQSGRRFLLISYPGRRKMTMTLPTLSKQGTGLVRFNPGKKAKTGQYHVRLYELQGRKRVLLASHWFKVEAYRIPKFEVRLFGKRKVPSDRPFKVSASAVYYAGGVVAGQKIRWRVTERVISYTPPGRRGFRFASNYRFSRRSSYRTRVLLEKTSKLNQRGTAELKLDPTKNLYLRALRYTIEATVTGDDGRPITAYRTIRVLPGFSVGVKLTERFRLKPGVVSPQLVAVDLKGKLVKDVRLHVELLRREWHFQLMETDLSRGGVKYNSDIVDKVVARCVVVSSGKIPTSCNLKADRSGVYVLRVRARDRLNRLQTVSLDMFVEGKKRLTWDRPKAGVFKLSLDKSIYVAGGKARLLLRSPFQSARALVIVEDPAGNTFRWVDVKGGKAVVTLALPPRFAPNVPVHVLLLQGRIRSRLHKGMDIGRPQTLAASTQIRVTPRSNRVLLAMKMPKTARPGSQVDITLGLKTPDGKAVAGEVTIWAVDRAVLSLAKERRLDPLGSFVKKRYASIRIRDTRRLLLGRIATRLENSGGGGGDMSRMGRQTVRKNFRAVAFYRAQLAVGKKGLKLRVSLPDDLTTFEVRAIATSGARRFGFTRRNLRVNLPVMVQRVLPRFVRPGDRLMTGALARVTAGKGGAATVSVKAFGLRIKTSSQRSFSLHKTKAVPVYFSFEVDAKVKNKVKLQMRVTRKSDKATDAFQASLPVKSDRRRLYFLKEYKLTAANKGMKLFAKWPENIRPGSGRVELLVSARGELLRSLAALEYLLDYPYGCAEQRVSRAFALLALQRTLKQFSLSRLDSARLTQGIREVVEHLPTVQGQNGLFAYWPRSRGNVWLTSYLTSFLVQAKKAGYPVKARSLTRALTALRRSLRSDWLHGGRDVQTRADVLLTLAQAGLHQPASVRAMFMARQQLDLFGRSRLLRAMLLDRSRHGHRITALSQELWANASFEKVGGKLRFQGLNFARKTGWNGGTLSSKTRTLAGVLEALALATPGNTKLVALKDALLQEQAGYGWQNDGQGASWGNTQNNARAILALRAFLQSQQARGPKFAFQIKTSTGWGAQHAIGGKGPLARSLNVATDAPLQFRLTGGKSTWLQWFKNKDRQPVWVRARISYLPNKPGSDAKASHKGLTVLRSLRVFDSKGKLVRSFTPKAGDIKTVAFGRVLEEKVRLLTTRRQTNVALEVPIAAGVELLNPRLRTVSSLAKTAGRNSVLPSHIEYLDDRIRFFFDVLPRGDHKLYFRTRTTTAGQFVTPAAHAEVMYLPTKYGRSQGYSLRILKAGQK
jgi:uncharacterized protein YfaS (alpha-2-macroglobulin family)